MALERAYEPTGEAGTGTLTVTLKPPTVAAGQGRWRLLGEGDAAWLVSGAPLSSLRPGAYLVEAQPVAGRITPAPQAVLVAQGGAATLTMTYFEGTVPATGTLPAPVPIETVSGNEALPYAWVGQVRGPVRSGSGVVVKPRVVATAGHVVFDESTLTAVPDLQWLFQRDLDVHEPAPLRPRGYYLLSGYADRREAAATPAGAALYRVLVTGP